MNNYSRYQRAKRKNILIRVLSKIICFTILTALALNIILVALTPTMLVAGLLKRIILQELLALHFVKRNLRFIFGGSQAIIM
ncbi:MAG: hypothetical protein CME81_00050 [Halomonas sp.]|nr:hypothetical protein [Halomonas sp.]